MTEEILSFVWRFQYFDKTDLRTDENLSISVLRTGHKNHNAGPDFLEAGVVIDEVNWHGSVEIHVRASDWFLHTHETNPAYESVVLHVVWENDVQILRQDGTVLPTLSLKPLVKTSILERYSLLQDSKEEIPCANTFRDIHEIHKYAMLDRALLERLDRKAGAIHLLLENNRNNWDETAYQWLGMHFGFKLNDPPFLRLTQFIPWKIIQKHRDRLFQIEALLFGCAGLIPDESDEVYVRQLRNEFHFLATKYKLSRLQAHEWRYARLRPAGFPTIRLAQFARLLSMESNLFSQIISAPSFERLLGMLQTRQSDYWLAHYVFEKKAAQMVPAMGKDAGSLLIINGVVPLLVAYSKQRNQPDLLDKAIYWLSLLPAENNRITRAWTTLGMDVKTSADSQALIEWHNSYCVLKKCLDCTVGAGLVRSA